MKALQAYIYTSLGHLCKLLTAFLLNKMIAYHLGPQGMGLLGNFMTLGTSLFVLAGGGILSAVVRNVSHLKDNELQRKSFFTSAFSYGALFSTAIFIAYLIGHEKINTLIFGGNEYAQLTLLLFLAQFIFFPIQLIIGYLNGLQETKKYSSIVIVGNLVALPLGYYLILKKDFVLSGLAILLPNLMMIIPALYYFFKEHLHKLIKLSYDKHNFKLISKFSLMTLISATLYPFAEIMVRSMIIDGIGLQQAGLFQGLLKLSSVYLSFITTFLAVYFLPMVAKHLSPEEIQAKVFSMLKMVMALFIPLAILLVVFRNSFIELGLSKDFLQVADFMIYQLSADFFKVIGYVFGFVIMAKAHYGKYILVELIQASGFYFILKAAFDYMPHLQSIYMAEVIHGFFYLMVVFTFYKLSLRTVKKEML